MAHDKLTELINQKNEGVEGMGRQQAFFFGGGGHNVSGKSPRARLGPAPDSADTTAPPHAPGKGWSKPPKPRLGDEGLRFWG